MLSAKLHRLHDLTLSPRPPAAASRRPTSSIARPPIPLSRDCRSSSLVVVCSTKKLLGRRRPIRRRELTSPSVEEEVDDEARTAAFPAFPALGSEQTTLWKGQNSQSSPDIGLPPADGPSGEAPPKQVEGEPATGTSLRGSDVLLALQKAVAQKRIGNRKGKQQQGSLRSGAGGRGVEEPEGDTGDVRTLDIKADWESRLDKLEKQIEDLQALQDLHS